jgi:hypothetical protein
MARPPETRILRRADESYSEIGGWVTVNRSAQLGFLRPRHLSWKNSLYCSPDIEAARLRKAGFVHPVVIVPRRQNI